MSNDNTVYIRKCAAYDYPAVKRAVDEIGACLPGGWAAAIPDGARVLLKPNFLKPAPAEAAVSPHPAVVRAVVEACREAGAGSVMIGDSPGIGSAQKVARACGIMTVAEELGVEVVDFSESVVVKTPAGFVHRQFEIARQVAEADVVINLPKFKTHAMMGLTLAVKNLYGVIVGRQKARWHFQSGRDYLHFARLLLELAYTVKPVISILDAVVGMQGNGPSSGTPRPLGYLAASCDMVSLDRVVIAMAGVPAAQIYTHTVAEQMGLAARLADIPRIGDALEDLTIHDLVPAKQMHIEGPGFIRCFSWLCNRFVTTRPLVDASRCRRCGICLEACPAQCMRLGATGPVAIQHRECIRCFCCQELCPDGAIRAHDAAGVRLLRLLGMEG